MSNKGQNLLSILKFDGDYYHWQMRMENLLKPKEWWHLIHLGYVEPEKYQGNQRVQRAQLQALRREFEILEMKKGETITDYISKVIVILNSVGNNGEILKETQIEEKILRTLTEKFNYIFVSIKESKDITTLTVVELQSSLIVHEQKFRKKVKEEEQVLKVTQEGFGKFQKRSISESYRGRGRGRSSPHKAIVECYNCHKLEHFQFECLE
ncbi:hypothetical protein Tco_0210278 [Tanacetum coccineum]